MKKVIYKLLDLFSSLSLSLGAILLVLKSFFSAIEIWKIIVCVLLSIAALMLSSLLRDEKPPFLALVFDKLAGACFSASAFYFLMNESFISLFTGSYLWYIYGCAIAGLLIYTIYFAYDLGKENRNEIYSLLSGKFSDLLFKYVAIAFVLIALFGVSIWIKLVLLALLTCISIFLENWYTDDKKPAKEIVGKALASVSKTTGFVALVLFVSTKLLDKPASNETIVCLIVAVILFLLSLCCKDNVEQEKVRTKAE